MTLTTGTILHSRYRVVKLVGQGGFGAVYRGWDMALNRAVAVKENIDTGLESQRQFEREAQLLANLRHPNLPVVIDHFILPGQGQYLVMDFIEGKSLDTLLAERGGSLGEAEVLPWMRQVCDALDYLHTQTPPIIHRDIKPANILITARGQAMLVDFGISKLFDPSKGTTLGARGVTPGYSPPEQYGRGRTDPRSDVYSLGATLYTLLTGQVPPDAPDLSSGADVLVPPREVNAAVSEETSQAIVAAMVLSISQRLGGAGELGRALSAGPPPPLPTKAPPHPPSLPNATPAPPKATPLQAAPLAVSAPRKRVVVPLWGWVVGVWVLAALIVWGTSWARGSDGQTPEITQSASGGAEATTVQSVAEPSATPQPSVASITPLASGPQAGDIRVVTRGSVEVEQVFVPAGSFIMGSDDGDDDEQPVHQVTLDGFWMDRREVTNAQYASCVAQGGCSLPDERSSYTRARYYGDPIYANFPVISVNWNDAQAFSEWAGGQLPTEAEWEYAARGPANSLYPWGNNPPTCELVNYSFDCAGDTTQVGAFLNNGSWVGALDMAGNVWEWTSDFYAADYYSLSPETNPKGPSRGDYRSLRGGAWNGDAGASRATNRATYDPHSSNYDLGFRVVEPVSEPGS